LWAGDLIVVPRNTHHRIINDSSKACRMLIVFSSPNREFVEV
jgi:oxalate decarboxylase/phosphoglucose isomerase-like protein (cupin superfamily)